MNVRILNPGPSLSRYQPDDFAGLVIGVNRAATAFCVDVWACCDYPAIKKYHHDINGAGVLLTRRQTWIDIGYGRWKKDVAITEDVILDDAPPWQTKTMTCAMAYAFDEGATEIELFGCDWKGTADFDGVAAGEDRTDKRWEQEAADVTALMKWMAGKGVTVARHL